MPKYLIRQPYITARRWRIEASAENPAVIDLPDSVVPSRTWEPMDEAAQKALLELQKRDVAKIDELVKANRRPALTDSERARMLAPRPIVGVPKVEKPDPFEPLTMREFSGDVEPTRPGEPSEPSEPSDGAELAATPAEPERKTRRAADRSI